MSSVELKDQTGLAVLAGPVHGPLIPSLNGIRAISIALVIGSHAIIASGNKAWLPVQKLLISGELGVRIFFVISGFLITQLLMREFATSGTISLSRFYGRRFLRLMPVYLLFISVLAFLDWNSSKFNLPVCNYVSSLTYTKNYFCSSWDDAHLWSLAVEEQFYFIWPLYFLLIAKSLRSMIFGLLALIVLTPIYRTLAYLDGTLNLHAFLYFCDVLGIGCAAALLLSHAQVLVIKVLKQGGHMICFLALFAVFAPLISSYYQFATKPILVFGGIIQAIGIVYLVLWFAYIDRGLIYRWLNTWAMNYIGLLSYSLYVWQQVFFNPSPMLATSTGIDLPIIWAILVTVGVAMLSYHGVERPIMRWRDRLSPRLGNSRLEVGALDAASSHRQQ